MDDWRDRILKEFTPKIAPLTLVADPDGLLLEEALLEGLVILLYKLLSGRVAWEGELGSRRAGSVG